MKLFKKLKSFGSDDSGAVTVDWVVLTAALVGIGIAVLTSVQTGMDNVTDRVAGDMSAEAAMTYSF